MAYNTYIDSDGSVWERWMCWRADLETWPESEKLSILIRSLGSPIDALCSQYPDIEKEKLSLECKEMEQKMRTSIHRVFQIQMEAMSCHTMYNTLKKQCTSTTYNSQLHDLVGFQLEKHAEILWIRKLNKMGVELDWYQKALVTLVISWPRSRPTVQSWQSKPPPSSEKAYMEVCALLPQIIAHVCVLADPDLRSVTFYQRLTEQHRGNKDMMQLDMKAIRDSRDARTHSEAIKLDVLKEINLIEAQGGRRTLNASYGWCGDLQNNRVSRKGALCGFCGVIPNQYPFWSEYYFALGCLRYTAPATHRCAMHALRGKHEFWKQLQDLTKNCQLIQNQAHIPAKDQEPAERKAPPKVRGPAEACELVQNLCVWQAYHLLERTTTASFAPFHVTTGE
ncbi:hypothetical protein EJ04DRAFT_581263 [Polyplosphaeria fusca]|uniref:Uncharacterized protein n=1 Tax=Polyplosphaeria fusca TaxID=682080 RepID=A0A9P4QJQ9_9PLEO|nr:hypothetical protein EJ04DRAFT_581263 [Polyplosphaeria fusca]